MMIDTTVLFFIQGALIPICAWVSFKRGWNTGVKFGLERVVNRLIDSNRMSVREVEKMLDCELYEDGK